MKKNDDWVFLIFLLIIIITFSKIIPHSILVLFCKKDSQFWSFESLISQLFLLITPIVSSLTGFQFEFRFLPEKYNHNPRKMWLGVCGYCLLSLTLATIQKCGKTTSISLTKCISSCIAPPICEETVFRSWFFPNLCISTGTPVALTITSLSFSLCHINAGIFEKIIIFALSFGWTLLNTQYHCLLPSYICHFVHNVLSLAPLCEFPKWASLIIWISGSLLLTNAHGTNTNEISTDLLPLT